MNKMVFFVLLALLIASCSTSTDGFVLRGELRGDIEDSTRVFLKINDTVRRGFIDIDTAYITQGTFEFRGTSNIPSLHYLIFDGVRGNAPVILENGTIEFEAQMDSLADAKIKGTEQNRLYMVFMDEQREMKAIEKTFNQDLRKANASRDTATVNSLREEYFELQERSRKYNVEFVEAHPNSLLSALILWELAQRKVLSIKQIEELNNKFTPEIQKTRPFKKIKELIETQKKTDIGSVAPEFSGPTPNGELLALNDVKGKVTLIDFWAGWCKPCRMENPNIVSVYERYKDKGLEVVGVSLDRNREQWLRAIEDDGLEWNHISNVQYFNGPIAKLYNINAIPAAFLLDENGVIVAKNLRGQALEAKVAELLN